MEGFVHHLLSKGRERSARGPPVRLIILPSKSQSLSSKLPFCHHPLLNVGFLPKTRKILLLALSLSSCKTLLLTTAESVKSSLSPTSFHGILHVSVTARVVYQALPWLHGWGLIVAILCPQILILLHGTVVAACAEATSVS